MCPYVTGDGTPDPNFLGAVFQWGCVAPRTLPWIPVTIIYFNIQHISTLSSNITAVILQIIFLCMGHMAGNAQLKRARVVRTILLGCLTDWYDSNSIQSWNHGCVGFTYAIDVCVEKIGCSRVWMFQPNACNCQSWHADSWARSIAGAESEGSWRDRISTVESVFFGRHIFVWHVNDQLKYVKISIWYISHVCHCLQLKPFKSDLGWPPELALEMQLFNMHAK